MKNVITIIMFIALAIIFADGIQPQGNGTEEAPYLVESLDNLLWITTNEESWSSHFLQTNDIDASETENWNDGLGFEPIGEYDESNDLIAPFTGVYDGGVYNISNLNIVRPDEEFVALFRIIENSTLQNITLIDVNIEGDFYESAASLVGKAIESEINNCSCTGNLKYASGLIYVTNNSLIDDCFSNVSIETARYSAGLISQISNTTVTNCYSLGELFNRPYFITNSGGLVNSTSDSQINNCYSSMDISSEGSCGGLVFQGSNSEIQDCHFNGSINAERYGGITTNIDIVVINSFYDFETVLINNSHNLSIGAISNDLYTTWLENGKNLDINEYLSREQDIYLMNSAEEFLLLQAFGQFNFNFKLNNDIDLSDYPNQFIPYFRGTLDGNDYNISNLNIQDSDYNGVGLLGIILNSTIKNLNITNSNIVSQECSGILGSRLMFSNVVNCNINGIISGEEHIGGIVSRSIQSVVDSCNIDIVVNCGSLTGGVAARGFYSTFNHIKGSITLNSESDDTEGSMGGLIGYASYCFVNNSNLIIDVATNNSNGSYNIGGLIGLCFYSELNNCYTIGNISGDGRDVGGVIGALFSNSTIKNCYSRANVTGLLNVAGFIGSIFEGNLVQNCYSTGSVLGVDSSGGLISLSVMAYITSSFWDTESSNQSFSNGGTPKTTYEMKEISTYTNISEPWDFVGNQFEDNQSNDYWDINPNINDGYPYLTNSYEEPVSNEDTEQVVVSNELVINSVYPNPFNPTTTISYTLSRSSAVAIDIFNIKGQKVSSDKIGIMNAGSNTYSWNGTNSGNKQVTSGMYLFKIKTKNQECVTKGILLK